MAARDVAGVRRRRAERLRKAAVAEVRRWWRQMDRADLDGSWSNVGPQILSAVTLAQLRSAEDADTYLSDVLSEQDIDVDPDGEIVPDAFSGIASDGRDLDSLLYQPVIAAKQAISQGQSPARAMRVGDASLSMITGTQVTDAGRTAEGVALAARHRVGGYVRMLTLPSCDRCVVLAGRWYRWNQGFQRHPQCDCRHIPTSEDRADDIRTDPRRAIESGQVRGLSEADREAIVDEGADPSQVINARRGMYTAGGRKFTTEGVTRRGLAGQRLGARRGRRASRLRPEQVYREAGGNREEAVRLLRLHGYIV